MPYVSLEWLGEHVEVAPDTTIEELATDLTRVGLEEEGIVPPPVTGPLVVGKVLTLDTQRQSNGKDINYCRVDVGSEHNDAPGTGKEPSELASRGIICGAHNFAVGDSVVVALPGSVLPGNFAISARKTYGHISDGMICSQRELGLGEDHTGIIVLEKYLPADEEVPAPGSDALALLGLGEPALEINVTPDRGYCFSMRGIAREYSHATGAAFTDPGAPSAFAAPIPDPTPDGFPVEVDDDAPIHGRIGCDRFVTRIVRGIDPLAPTPRWMQRRLRVAGMRPISLAVDVTNYVMLDLGQPIHAYDLALMEAPIVVRRARAGETLVTLDDVERALDPEDLLITDSRGGRAARVLGLAGVMGGASTEISENTRDVLIEAAHFEPVSIARTARRHKLPSEAAKRFERGTDPLLPTIAAQRCVDLLVRYGGGTADPAVSGHCTLEIPPEIAFPLAEPARLIGVDYSRERILEILEMIGCVVNEPETGASAAGAPEPEIVSVTPPSWRADLTVAADLTEEVARIDGYDRIPLRFPITAAGTGLTGEQKARRAIAQALAEQGWTDVLSYPFIGAVHDAFGYAADDPRRQVAALANPLADDAPLLRSSLLDTLVETARRNIARGLPSVAISEIGMVTRPTGEEPVAAIPAAGSRPTAEEIAELQAATFAQPRHVAGIASGPRAAQSPLGTTREWDWADAITAARSIGETVGVTLEVAQAECAPWHPGRCAELSIAGEVVGYAGELHPQVLRRLELPARAVAFELDLDAVVAAISPQALRVKPVSTFPALKEDFAFVVGQDTPAAHVQRVVARSAGELAEEVRVFDVFAGEQIGEGKKSVAVAVRLRAADHTVSPEESAEMRRRIVRAAESELGASLRA